MSNASSKRKADKKSDGGGGKKGSHKKCRPDSSAAPPSSTPSNSKRALKQERQTHRRHAESVTEAKRIWNQLRLKNNTPKETRALMDQLLPLIDGKVQQIALQHDASRVIQAAIQFGTPQERQEILKELASSQESVDGLADLSKNQYAHFSVIKAIKYGRKDPVCVKLIVKGLKGHMPKLAVHAVASRVVESLFQTFSDKQTAVLKQEFYGPHFSLFAAESSADSATPTLASNLKNAPEKKEVTLEFVRHLIDKGMEKVLYGYSYFQKLAAEYVDVAAPNDIRSLAGTAADHVIHLISSRAGTKVGASLIAYGTAKDRKRILKNLKGYARDGLLHADAYLAFVRLIQLTDDTVALRKNLLNELLLTTSDSGDAEESGSLSPLLDVALSETGAKLLYLILMDDNETRRKLFDPYEHSVLFSNPTIVEDGKEVPTSKKDPQVRRKELLQYMRQPLIDLCINHADELLRSRPGSIVLRETYRQFHSKELVEATVAACKTAVDEASGERDEALSLFEDPVGHLAIKNLLLVDVDDPEALFASTFHSQFHRQLITVCQSNRGAFVVGALLKVSVVGDDVANEMKSHKKSLQECTKRKGAKSGFETLLKALS